MPAESSPVFDGSRSAWQHLADRLLSATFRHASPTGALVALPGPSSASGSWSDGMEGYARTFLLAAFRVAGAAGDDPDGLLERFRDGLVAGVDPLGFERWPTIAERRQTVVEAASVAIALSETRPWLWDRLSGTEQQHVVDWLSGVVGTTGYTNNWIWFQNVIEAFLARVGGPWEQSDLDRNLELQERLYVGDGWYSDGASPTGARQSFDYYAGWAWHVYPLLHARIQGEPLSALHRERLAMFIDQARDLVGAHGAPLFQGRSLTYRFGMLAPFWAASIAGVSPLPTGATRSLARDVTSHFLDAGAVGDDGLLSIGWHDRFLPIRQVYTSGSSPYWTAKGFLGLLLPDDHGEWHAEPAEPRRETTTVRALPAPGWLVIDTPGDGIVRVVNHGSDGFRGPAGAPRTDNPFYQRASYSNMTSPDLSPAGIAAPLESHTALLDTAGAPSHRDVIERVQLTDTVAVSRSRVHWLDTEHADTASWASLRRGPIVTTASVVHGVHELRLAWWTSAVADPRPSAAVAADSVWPDDPGPWRFRIGGWALPFDGDVTSHDGTATRADGVTTAVLPIRGLDLAETTTRSGSDPFAAHSITAWAASSAPIDAGDVVAALVVLTGTSADADATVLAGIDVDDDAVLVRWSDGATDLVPRRAEVAA